MLKIGVLDTVLRLSGKPQAVALAKTLGLAAVQVTLGRSLDGKCLPLEDPGIQSAWVAPWAATGSACSISRTAAPLAKDR